MKLESGTKKLREKLSQEEDSEEEALEEFNSTLDNALEKLRQEKGSPDDFYGFMYDTDDDDASISGKSYQLIQVVVVQNNVQQEVVGEVVLYPPVHEDVAEEMINKLKKEDQARGLESPKKRWSRMKSQRKDDKDPLVSLVFGS
ncbi:hypothetical protein Tco_0629427 [Tanacetum coccineum]|uniref:Uncharacterized protein n=1 Tax=Tanacetum coccineum TaxID=301880 RepID=A0ABQ4WT42_9ASTR